MQTANIATAIAKQSHLDGVCESSNCESSNCESSDTSAPKKDGEKGEESCGEKKQEAIKVDQENVIDSSFSKEHPKPVLNAATTKDVENNIENSSESIQWKNASIDQIPSTPQSFFLKEAVEKQKKRHSSGSSPLSIRFTTTSIPPDLNPKDFNLLNRWHHDIERLQLSNSSHSLSPGSQAGLIRSSLQKERNFSINNDKQPYKMLMIPSLPKTLLQNVKSEKTTISSSWTSVLTNYLGTAEDKKGLDPIIPAISHDIPASAATVDNETDESKIETSWEIYSKHFHHRVVAERERRSLVDSEEFQIRDPRFQLVALPSILSPKSSNTKQIQQS